MDRPERSQKLGEHGRGPTAVTARVRIGEVPDQRLGQHGRGLVGVAAPAVQVQVVHRFRMPDPYDDVVRVDRPEPRSRRADHDDRGPSGEGVQAQRLGERPHHRAGLAGAGRADGEQRGAEQIGVEAEAGAAVGVRVAGVVGGDAEPHLPGQHVVPGEPGRQVTLPGGVQTGGGAVLEHGAGERGEGVPAAAHALPGADDPGVVHVPHQPGAGLAGEALGGVDGSGGAELGPLGGVLFGAGGRSVRGADRRFQAGGP